MRRRRSVPGRVWPPAALALAAFAWFWATHRQHDSHNTPPAAAVLNPVPEEPTRAAANPPPGALTKQTARIAITPPAAPIVEDKSLPNRAPNEGPSSGDTRTNLTVGQPPPTNYPRPIQNVFEAQLALARLGISSGSLDGQMGPQTRSALRAFQQKEHLATTGDLDDQTRQRLLLSQQPTGAYVVTSNDLARLQPLSLTWLGKSQQTALEYETLLELVSEKAQSAPSLVRRLNPQVIWTNVSVCTRIELPNIDLQEPSTPAAFLTIQLGDKILEAWDERTNLLAHFPCSIARQVEKRPVGRLQVSVIALHPNYTFDPDNFPESAEAQELKTKLVLPPGPNNPVGVAWIGLDKPGYGIHGTPKPEQVGRTESHGCFRLANWNAEYLVRLVAIGTPVYVQP